jgi:hypothetical protein
VSLDVRVVNTGDPSFAHRRSDREPWTVHLVLTGSPFQASQICLSSSILELCFHFTSSLGLLLGLVGPL